MAPVPQNDGERVYNVLLTGFGPFQNVPVNPSWQILQPLQGLQYMSVTGRNIKLHCVEISVAYDEVSRIAPSIHGLAAESTSFQYDSSNTILFGKDKPHFDLVLHIGVSPARSYVSLERRARRFGYLKPDVNGIYCRGQTIEGRDHQVYGHGDPVYGVDDGEGELHTILNLDSFRNLLQTTGIVDSKISNDAGLYLCEFTYYASLACAKRQALQSGNSPTPVLFMHIPSENRPYSLSQLTNTAHALVTQIIDSIP